MSSPTVHARLEAIAARFPKIATTARQLHDFASAAGVDPSDVDDERLADLYLACACAAGDPAAAAEFQRAHLDVIRRAALRVLPEAAVSEVAQRVLEHLLVAREQEGPRIGTYVGKGPLRSFVRMVSVRLAIDAVRDAKSPDLALPPDLDAVLVDAADPEEIIDSPRLRERVSEALASALGNLSVSERRVLRMRYLLGFSVDRTAQALGVHEVSVSRMVGRARTKILRDLGDRLGDVAGGPDAVAAVARTFDVSLARHLASHPDVGT